MTFALRLAATLAFLLCLLSSGVARAQSVTVTRVERNDLDPGRDVKSINQANCVDNQEIEVTLNIRNPGDAQLEVWAGTSSGACETDANRNQTNTTQCRQVLSEEATDNVTVGFTVQSLLPRPSGGGNICDQDSGIVRVWFLLIAGGVTQAGAPTVDFTYDLAGPRPPTVTDILAGEGSLELEWSGSSSNDIGGYRIYCEEAFPSNDDEEAPAPETGGTTATGGTSGTGTTEGEAGASTGEESAGGAAPTGSSGNAGTAALEACRGLTTLRAGSVPPARFERGSASQASGRGTARNLDNFTRYACGVSAYDDDDNVGVLSSMRCARPRPVLDYFEAYRAAGGQAGGGYCRFGRGPGSGFAVALGLTALGLAARRRRARSRTRQIRP